MYNMFSPNIISDPKKNINLEVYQKQTNLHDNS